MAKSDVFEDQQGQSPGDNLCISTQSYPQDQPLTAILMMGIKGLSVWFRDTLSKARRCWGRATGRQGHHVAHQVDAEGDRPRHRANVTRPSPDRRVSSAHDHAQMLAPASTEQPAAFDAEFLGTHFRWYLKHRSASRRRRSLPDYHAPSFLDFHPDLWLLRKQSLLRLRSRLHPMPIVVLLALQVPVGVQCEPLSYLPSCLTGSPQR